MPAWLLGLLFLSVCCTQQTRATASSPGATGRQSIIDDRRPRGIIFDLGGVIVDLEHEAFRDNITRLMGRFDDPALHAIFDKLQRGVVGESQFYDELRAYAGNSALSDQELEQAWKSQIGAVSCEKVALMRRVREMGYKTFILSTTNAPHLEVIQDRFASCLPEARDPLRESVDAAFLTFEMQMLKPDVEIYLAVIERTGLRGDQLLFLDDTPKNVLGAQHAGLHSLLIDGPGFLHWLPALLQ